MNGQNRPKDGLVFEKVLSDSLSPSSLFMTSIWLKGFFGTIYSAFNHYLLLLFKSLGFSECITADTVDKIIMGHDT